MRARRWFGATPGIKGVRKREENLEVEWRLALLFGPGNLLAGEANWRRSAQFLRDNAGLEAPLGFQQPSQGGSPSACRQAPDRSSRPFAT